MISSYRNTWALRELFSMSQKYNFIALMVNPKPVSIGFNNMSKTHPVVSRYNPLQKLHCEIDCLHSAPYEKIKGSTIFLWRKKGNGFGMAKPCAMCENEMRKYGVKEVVYSTEIGFEIMKL